MENKKEDKRNYFKGIENFLQQELHYCRTDRPLNMSEDEWRKLCDKSDAHYTKKEKEDE